MNFLLTGAGAGARRRRSLRAGSFQDYKDLALASGGQAIQVTKTQLPQATDVVLDTSTSALVRPAYKNSTKCGLSKSSKGAISLLLSCSVRWRFCSGQGALGKRKPSRLCWMNPCKTSRYTSQEHLELQLHSHWPTHRVQNYQKPGNLFWIYVFCCAAGRT